MTLELGRIRTWRLPVFSALLMALSASLRTEVLTILAVLEILEARNVRLEVSAWLYVSLQEPDERKECPSGARGAMKGSSAHGRSRHSSVTTLASDECQPWLPEGHLLYRFVHTSVGSGELFGGNG